MLIRTVNENLLHPRNLSTMWTYGLRKKGGAELQLEGHYGGVYNDLKLGDDGFRARAP